jgi:hypothetical protein
MDRISVQNSTQQLLAKPSNDLSLDMLGICGKIFVCGDTPATLRLEGVQTEVYRGD